MRTTFCLLLALIASPALAQDQPAAPKPPTSKPVIFDVVTIKPAKPGENWHYGFSTTGYSAVGVSLQTVIYQAYFSMNMGGKDAIAGAPDWVSKDQWDIEAKVAPEDMEAYQESRKHLDDPNSMPHLLLQSLLADRFHLVVHRTPAEMDGYALTVAPKGPKLTDAKPDEQRPEHGIPVQGGGYMAGYNRGEYPRVTYNSVTMAGFASALRGTAGGPVIDRTGLTGKYDFNLEWLSAGPDEQHVGAVEFSDPDKLSHWNFSALGLRATHVKLPTEHVVIDSISKPTEN